MNKNTILVNLKHTALYAALPLLLVACGKQKNTNVAAELAETEAKLASIEQTLNTMQQQTDSLVADSLPRSPKTIELSKKIKKYKQGLRRLKAPKDTARIKMFNRKIQSLLIDSMMNATNVKQHIVNKRVNEFRAIYKQQDLLRARRDSLMKIKSR